MDDLQKVTATVTALDWTPDAIAKLYDPSLSPFGPLATAGEVFKDCYLYMFEYDTQRAYVAVKPVSFHNGKRLDVVGARSIGDKMDGAAFADAVNHIANYHGASLIGLMTKIPKIADKCIAAGFEITGAVLLKAVV